MTRKLFGSSTRVEKKDKTRMLRHQQQLDELQADLVLVEEAVHRGDVILEHHLDQAREND